VLTRASCVLFYVLAHTRALVCLPAGARGWQAVQQAGKRALQAAAAGERATARETEARRRKQRGRCVGRVCFVSVALRKSRQLGELIQSLQQEVLSTLRD